MNTVPVFRAGGLGLRLSCDRKLVPAMPWQHTQLFALPPKEAGGQEQGAPRKASGSLEYLRLAGSPAGKKYDTWRGQL